MYTGKPYIVQINTGKPLHTILNDGLKGHAWQGILETAFQKRFLHSKSRTICQSICED
jgi:hypothetical protein